MKCLPLISGASSKPESDLTLTGSKNYKIWKTIKTALSITYRIHKATYLRNSYLLLFENKK